MYTQIEEEQTSFQYNIPRITGAFGSSEQAIYLTGD